MKQLQESGLYGYGLVLVNTKELVGRYNACLQALGLPPTKLKSFHVDLLGWSPEIAQELQNQFYLCHSLANPLGIWVSLQQAHAPCYMPFHSFDPQMLHEWFRANSAGITDILQDDGIYFDFDEGLSTYETPLDLLNITTFTVRVETPRKLLEASRAQRALEHEFMAASDAWFSSDMHQKIFASREKFGGDFRGRSTIADYPFKVDTYFCQSFGGVFIIRHTKSGEPMVIVRNKEHYKKLKKKHNRVYTIDTDLVEAMLKEGLITIDPQYYLERQERVWLKAEYILSEHVCFLNSKLDYVSVTSAERKGLIHAHKDTLPKAYFELEKVIHALANGNSFNPNLSRSTQVALVHPNMKLPLLPRRVINQVLSEIDPTDIIRLYRFNKPLFYRLYENEWTECKKRFAANVVTDYYIKRKKK